MLKRRPRLRDFDYRGRYRCFLTFCTHARRRYFTDRRAVDDVCPQILRAADEEDMAVLAYVCMPDHVHLLVQGERDDSELRRFACTAKQLSGYAFARRTGQRLWQPSYYDHVLRDDESELPYIRYVLENPVRAGLVDACEAYPFLGAGTVPVGEMLRMLAGVDLPVWRR